MCIQDVFEEVGEMVRLRVREGGGGHKGGG